MSKRTKFAIIAKILFIATHRKDRAPNQRYRFEQYLEWLESQGFQCELSFLLSEEDDKKFYSKGHYLTKAWLMFRHYQKRKFDLKRANEYDIIFIVREALMFGLTKFEVGFSKSRAKVIFDFDDAIWLNDTSVANQMFAWMKNPSKIKRSIAHADLIFAGNQYLADFAKRYNPQVQIVPTTVDTDVYVGKPKSLSRDQIVIGWSGSLTTIKHFDYAVPVLLRIKQKFGDKIRIKVIGDASFRNSALGVQGIAWSKETELDELGEIDIGIMPLPDDEWARGKCGLKGLVYMSMEIPTIMSPVGVNSEIIQHGINGFLARTEADWMEQLSELIEKPELRKKLGKAGRQTVVAKYSVIANRELYLNSIRGLMQK